MSATLPQNRFTASLVFLVGAACMVVAGYFLIEGLSQFSGNETTRNVLIIGGILFQITESLCFIAAASLAFHSLIWRLSLFGLGCLLLLFSIGVMTLAQKTALQTGINEASAIDEKRKHIRDQLDSLNRMIDSYRENAQSQSKSIFKDSRALGQDSINRAADIERQKQDLSQQLFLLNQERKETSLDFFKRLEEVTGMPAISTEFYFLVLRSLLLELCGIILMAFGANLRALIMQQRLEKSAAAIVAQVATPTVAGSTPPIAAVADTAKVTAKKKLTSRAAPAGSSTATDRTATDRIATDRIATDSTATVSTATEAANQASEADFAFDVDNVDMDAEIAYLEKNPNVYKLSQHHYSEYIDGLRRNEFMSKAEKEVAALGESLIELYQRGIITSLSREGIIRGLQKHHNIDVDTDKANQIKQYLLAESKL